MGDQAPVTPETCSPIRPSSRGARSEHVDHSPIDAWASRGERLSGWVGPNECDEQIREPVRKHAPGEPRKTEGLGGMVALVSHCDHVVACAEGEQGLGGRWHQAGDPHASTMACLQVEPPEWSPMRSGSYH